MVSGEAVSTVQVRFAAAPVFPALSRCRAWNVWLPSARPLYAFGLAQVAKAPPSSEHLNVPRASPAKEKDADAWFVRLAGPRVIVGPAGGPCRPPS